MPPPTHPIRGVGKTGLRSRTECAKQIRSIRPSTNPVDYQSDATTYEEFVAYKLSVYGAVDPENPYAPRLTKNQVMKNFSLVQWNRFNGRVIERRPVGTFARQWTPFDENALLLWTSVGYITMEPLVPCSATELCSSARFTARFENTLYRVGKFSGAWTDASRYENAINQLEGWRAHASAYSRCAFCGADQVLMRNRREEFERDELNELQSGGAVDEAIPEAVVLSADNLGLKMGIESAPSCTAECPVCGCIEDSCVELECGHSFCKSDLLSWIDENKNSCPMCRRVVKVKVLAANSANVETRHCQVCHCELSEKRKNKDICNKCSNCDVCGEHTKGLFYLREPTIKVCETHFNIIMQNPTVRVDIPEVRAAESAPVERKRGTRGGKAFADPKQKGYCYLWLFSFKARPEARRKLGRNPKIEKIYFHDANRSSIPRKLVLRGDHYHVTIDPNWKVQEQLEWLLDHHKDRVVGNDDPEEITQLPEWNPIESGEYWDEEEGILYTVEPVKVGGPGDCWKRVPYLEILAHDKWEMTVADFASYVIESQESRNKIAGGEVWVKWCYQDDGDLHIITTGIRMQEPFENCVQLWNYAKIEIEDIDDSWQELSDFVECALEQGTRLIGKEDKSPLDSATRNIQSPEVRRGIETNLSNTHTRDIAQARELCPYYIPPKYQHYMAELKLPWLSTSAEVVPHPIHAAVRRWECFDVIPKYVKSACTVVSMNDSNYNWVRQKVPQEYDMPRINPVVDLKDISRYAGTNTVPKDVFTIGAIETPGVIFHNSGQFITEATLLKIFEDNPSVMYVYVSSIYPLAAMISDKSPQPDLYDYVIDKKNHTMVYIPECHSGGAYEQPDDPGLLLTSTIFNDDRTIKIRGGVVESMLNTHCMVFQRWELSVPNYLVLSTPGYMRLPRLFENQPKDLAMIPVDWFKKLYGYAMTIPNLKDQDLWAKMRQFAEQERIHFSISDRAWTVKIIATMAQCDLTGSPHTRLYDNLLDEISYKTWGHIRRWWKRKFEMRYVKRTREIVDERDSVVILPRVTKQVRTKGGDLYGVEWVITPEDADDWWDKLCYWFRRLIGDQPKIDLDKIPAYDRHKFCIALTSRNVRHHGLDRVIDTQVRSFLSTFERDQQYLVRTVAPVREVDHSVIEPTYDDDVAFEREHRLREKWMVSEFQDAKRRLEEGPLQPDMDDKIITPEPKRAEPMRNYYDRDGSISEPDGPSLLDNQEANPVVYGDEMVGIHPQPAPKPDATALKRRKWVPEVKGPEDEGRIARVDPETGHAYYPEEEEIIERTETYSSVDSCDTEELERFGEPSNLEEVIRGLKELNAKWGGYVPQEKTLHVPPGVEEKPKRLKLDPKAKMERPNPWRDDEIAPKDVIQDVPILPYRIRQHEDCVEGWNKLMKHRPKLAKRPQAQGTALWDYMFPMTIDKRYKDVPVREVVYYPVMDYPDQDCLLDALYTAVNIPAEQLLFKALKAFPKADIGAEYLTTDTLSVIAVAFSMNVKLVDKDKNLLGYYGVKEGPEITIFLHNKHFWATHRCKKILSMPAPKANIEMHPFGDMLKEISNLPIIRWKRWVPEHSRAAGYMRAISENTTGLMGQTEVQRVAARMLEKQMELASQCRPYPSYMAFIEGDPGCRKSSALQKVLRKQRFKKMGLYTVTTPTTILRADWADKLALKDKQKETGKGAPKELVQTFETALTDQSMGSLVVRDEDKFPKGYQATLALMYPHARFHIMLGDRYQSQWHEPNADCLLNDGQIPGEGEFYSQYTDLYLIGTWRFGPNIANFFRMPTFNKDPGGFHFTRDMVKSAPELRRFFPNATDMELQSAWRDALILYAADGAKRWGSDLLGRDTDTYSGSQGLTAPLTILVVDQRSLAMGDPRLLYTALTRSQNVVIVNLLSSSGEDQMRILGHPLLNKLLQYQNQYVDGRPAVIKCTSEGTFDIKETVGQLPRTTQLVLAGPPEKLQNWGSVSKFYDSDQCRYYIDPDTGEVSIPLKGGTRLRRDEPAYVDKFNFHVHIEDMPLHVCREPGFQEYVPANYKAKTKLPMILPSDIDERNHHDVMTRYSAELRWGNIFSEQFKDTPMVRADASQIFEKAVLKHERLFGVTKREARKAVTVQFDKHNPTYFNPHSILWGANQSSRDAASFAAGVAQRIRRKTREENIREFKDEQHFGNALWAAFHRYMGWGDPIPWDANLYEQCIIEFQERRADRSEALKKMSLNRADPDYYDFLTAKTQWKMKSKEFTVAKPLQTILVRSDEYVFKFGPLGIYLLYKLLEHCPEYAYIHAKKTEKDLADWLSVTPRDTTYVMSDVSGFDSSVRGASVTNELRFMEHFGVPQDLRDAYREDKMDFQTATIHFGIMRFSGEIFTFLFNTTHTMSREALKYQLMPGERMMGAGDDLLRFAPKPVSPEYFPYSAMDPTIEKRFESDRGEFCSFITKNGITVKDPRILWRRLAGQVERGKIHDVVLGYFLHFALNYRSRDDLFDILTEDEMDHQAAVNRFFFSEAGKLSTMAKKIDWSRVHVDEEHRTAGTAAGALTFLETINSYILSPISTVTEGEIESAYAAASSSSYLYD